MARDVFEEVKLGFLVVGHAHEDIDGCFGYLSKKLREKKLHFNKFDEGFHDLTIVMTFLVRECYGSPKKQEF
jgi:hypothetical protein